ncbi:MAG: hypothetical protein ACOH2M_14105, partial [Cypionkella sp.]
MTTPSPIDAVTRDLWQVIAATDEVTPGIVHTTLLLDQRIAFSRDGDGMPVVWLRSDEEQGDEIDLGTITARLPVITGYGYIWTSFGNPPDHLFPIPEYAEPDRVNMSCGSIGVGSSAPRIVENFLDMGHFPYVHTD